MEVAAADVVLVMSDYCDGVGSHLTMKTKWMTSLYVNVVAHAHDLLMLVGPSVQLPNQAVQVEDAETTS